MAKRTQEIERKWLVHDLPGLGDLKCEQIIQGYLSISSDGVEIRIRRKGDDCFETVKSQGVLTRNELEVESHKISFSRCGLPQKDVDWKSADTR